ncbi:hypothetical protein VP01_772g5 [Puccinia sorghi]|uniref:OTU domain-containing protein n=1 Tax=Puccinia sorghi TaxID=27349 RepID=A0A0L6UBG3_9BASI|nr:hypothetical protein VP01_772g5 [Puccinia sorghi]
MGGCAGLSRDARIYASSIATTPPPTASTVELTAYGLPEFSATQGFIVGDGNCQYRALSHLAYGDQQYHDYVRRYVTRELARNDHLYAGSSETDHTSFMYRQRDSGEWGVEQTLAAAAQVYQKKIIVLSLASDPFFVAYGSDHDISGVYNPLKPISSNTFGAIVRTPHCSHNWSVKGLK